MRRILLCLALQFAPAALAAQAAPDEAAILAAVQALYDGVKSRDTAALRRVVTPDFAMIALGDVNGTKRLRRNTGEGFVRLVGESKDMLEETLHRPVVQQHGDLATVSGDFTFRRNGAVSHCGYEVFSLLRIDGRWTLVSVVETWRPHDCGT